MSGRPLSHGPPPLPTPSGVGGWVCVRACVCECTNQTNHQQKQNKETKTSVNRMTTFASRYTPTLFTSKNHKTIFTIIIVITCITIIAVNFYR